jgi:ATP-binding cassette subfamily B protein
VIAHRLSTIIHAHEIVVLNAGKVIERGTHDDLLESEGRYAHMWHMQQNNAQKKY